MAIKRTDRVLELLTRHKGQWVCSKAMEEETGLTHMQLMQTVATLRRRYVDYPDYGKRIDSQHRTNSNTKAIKYRLIDSTACYYCGHVPE